MTDWKKLRELAEAATPGPWRGLNEQTHLGPENAAVAAHAIFAGPEGWRNGERRLATMTGPNIVADTAFIAAANPQTVIALLDDNAQLRAACAKWQEIFTGFPHDAQQALRDLNARVAAIVMAYDGSQAQLAAANAETERLRGALKFESELYEVEHDRADDNHDEARKLEQQLAAANVEIEKLRTAHAGLVRFGEEMAGNTSLRKQLAAMTKARDEACGIARALVRSTDDCTSWLESIDALEKVGQ